MTVENIQFVVAYTYCYLVLEQSNILLGFEASDSKNTIHFRPEVSVSQ